MQSFAVERDDQRLAATRPQEQYTRQRSPLLVGGMAADAEPHDLGLNQAVLLENVTVLAGFLQVALGVSAYGGSYIGQALGALQLLYANGTADTILVTTSYVYLYAAGQWQYTSDTNLFSTTAPVAGGANQFPLNSVSGMVIGDAIGILLSNSQQLRTTITNIVGTTVTTHDAVPAGLSVNNGATVAHPHLFTAPVDGQNQLQSAVFPATGWLILSNTVDPVFYYYQGITKTLPGLPSNTSCRAMCVAHEQLLLGNTIEGGTEFPGRIRASDLGDATNWSSGIAAIYNLVDTPDAIFELLILGPYVIVYREQTIMQGTYLGVLNETWFWQYMIYGEGAVSSKAAVSLRDVHLVVGHANVYFYSPGSYALQPVADPVFLSYFGPGGELDPTNVSRVFTYYSAENDEAWIFYPSKTSYHGWPDRLLRYVRKTNTWTHRIYGTGLPSGVLPFGGFTAANPLVPVTTVTWSTAQGPWTSWTQPWLSRVLLSNAANVLLAPSKMSVQVQLHDYAASTEDGYAIDWTIQSRAFGDGGTLWRWDELTILGQGTVAVAVSLDEGETFTSIGTFTLGASNARLRLTFQFVSNYIMFQFTGSDPTFELAWFEVGGEPESEW